MGGNMNYELIIFDMDGLMFDTEIFYYKSWFNFTDEYGFKYNIETRQKIAGMNETDMRDFLTKELGSVEKVIELRQRLSDYRMDYFRTYDKSLKKEGLIDLLEFAKAKNIKCVIASSNDKEKVELLAEKEGVMDYFDYIVAGDDVVNSKPNPEIFLKALEKSGIGSDKALILEDSYNGYVAAKNSGIDYLIVHDKSFEKLFDAEKEADSLYEVIDYLKNKIII